MLLQNLFEKHNVVFTVAGGLLSAGAAWAGKGAGNQLKHVCLINIVQACWVRLGAALSPLYIALSYVTPGNSKKRSCCMKIV